MADSLTAEQVGQVVTFVAPGFVARLAYVARFPRREPQKFALLITVVVLSLPIVALTNAVSGALGIPVGKATDLRYVALLLGSAAVLGFFAGSVRGWSWTRRLLIAIGLAYQPESSLYAQTLLALPAEAVVTIQFVDGKKLSGTPRLGPAQADEGIAELYLTHPAWWDPVHGRWVESDAGGGVIVPLERVHSVTLDRDPTRA